MTTLAVLTVLLNADASPMARSLNQGTAALTGFNAKVTGTGKVANAALGTAVPLGAAAAGLAIGKFAMDSVRAALEYDKAFTRISAISNASAQDIEQWRGEVMELAGETARAPEELADALLVLSSAGLDTGQIMETLEMSSKAAAIGLGSTTDVAKITANALNAYASSGLTAAQVTDTLVAAVREGSAEPEEFAAALGRILPIASQAGIEFDEVTASLAALSNIGLDVNEGVTAMRGLMTALFAPTNQSAMALKKMGLTADEVRASLAEEGLIATLRMLEEASGGNIDTMKALVPNVRALTGVFGLTVQEAEKVDAIFRNVQDSTGSLGEGFATTAESDAFKLQQAMNDLGIMGQQLAAELIPVVAGLAQAFVPLVGILGKLAPLIGVVAKGLEIMASPLLFLITELGQGVNPTAEQTAIIMEVLGRAMREAHVATEELHGGLVQGVSAEEAIAESADRAAAAHHRAAAAALEQKNATLALAGGMLGIVSQANAVQEAQDEVNRLQRQGKQGTEEYRQANLQLLQAGLSLTEQIKDYAVGLKGVASQKEVMRVVENLAADFGVQGAAARDLFSDVEDLIGGYGDVPSTVRTRLLAEKREAMAEIAALRGELDSLEHRAWIAHVQVVTEGGSTGFHLLEMLRGVLDSFEDKTWLATMRVKLDERLDALREGRRWAVRFSDGLKEELDSLVSVIADATKDKLADAWLEQAKAFRLQAKELQALVSDAENRLDRLMSRVEKFRDSISSAFDVDLVAGSFQAFQERNAELDRLMVERANLLDQITASADAAQTETLGAQLTAVEAALAALPSQAQAIQTFVADQVHQTAAFAQSLVALQAAGLSQGNLANLAAQGPSAAGFAQELLASPELIGILNQATASIAATAGATTDKLVNEVFGRAIRQAQVELDRVSDRLERFASKLDDFATALRAAAIKAEADEVVSGLRRLDHMLDEITGGNGEVADRDHPRGLEGREPATVVNVTVQGNVWETERLAEAIDRQLNRSRRRNGRLALDR